MLTEEEDVEIHALAGRGWSVSAIARHTGRDRKTVRRALAGLGCSRRSAPSALEPFCGYLAARFEDDPHVLVSVLHRELLELGFARSYQTLTRELRALGLRPVCEECRRGGPAVTVEIEHPAGEELQFDWLELPDAPWGVKAHVLVGTLSYSGRCRGVFSEAQTGAHVVEALDAILRRLGGTPRRWRTDRMAGVVDSATGRLLPEFSAVAKHYGVAIDVCPPRRGQRKGKVEKTNDYLTQSWWRSAPDVATVALAQASLDRFCAQVADRRPRGHGRTVLELALEERLQALPELPFPAEITVARGVSRSALVAFDGNQYSVPVALVEQTVTVRARVGEPTVQIFSAAGSEVCCHRRAPAGAGQLTRTAEHAAALEGAVLAAFTTRRPCARKANRPPGQSAQREAARLRAAQDAQTGQAGDDAVVVDLADYARLAEASSVRETRG